MNIVIISPEFPPDVSGVGDYAWHLARSLVEAGHKVSVLTSHRNGVTQISSPAINVHPLIESWDYASQSILMDKIVELQPDIIHINYHTCSFQRDPMINFLPLVIKLSKVNAKVVSTYHELAAPYKRFALLPQMMFSQVNVFTNDRDFDRLGPFKKRNKFSYVPLASNINMEPLSESEKITCRKEIKVEASQVVILRFGFINSLIVQSMIELLHVFKDTNFSNHEAKLVFVGDCEPESLSTLQTEVKKMNLGESVSFLGHKNAKEVSAYLQIADLALAPYPDGVSERRGAFLALVRHAVPTLTTKGKHFPKRIQDGVHVQSVATNAPREVWVSKLKELVTNQPLRQRIKKSLAELCDVYSWERVASEMDEIYKRMVKER